VKPNINSVDPQLSNNGHPLDGALINCGQSLITNYPKLKLPGPSFAQTGDGIKCQEVIRKVMQLGGENVQFQHNRASNV
jgi:hypothetical protein